MFGFTKVVAPHYELPSPGLFEIQAHADYDEKGEGVRCSLGNAMVKKIDSLYGVQLDETSPLAGHVRGYFSKKSFVVPNNYLVVRTPMGLIKDSSNKKWPFNFSGLFSLTLSSRGGRFTSGTIRKPVSLDSTEIIRASGNENCDLVVIKFSTEVSGCQEDVSLPKLEDLERPFFYLPKDPRRMSEAVLAMATYGNELLVKNKLGSGSRSWVYRPITDDDLGFIIRKPKTAKDAEKLFFYVAKFNYSNAKSVFDNFKEFARFRFGDKRCNTYFRRECSPLFLVALGHNYSSCLQYIQFLEYLITMIGRAVEFLDRVKVLPSGFHYSEFSEYGEVAFSKHGAVDEEQIRANFAQSVTEIQTAIDAVRRDLLPLVKETEDVWRTELGTKADIAQVAIHYLLRKVAMDPLMYVDHENEYVKGYARMLISG